MKTLDDSTLAAYCSEALDPGEELALERWQADAPLNALRLGGVSAQVGFGPSGICPEAMNLPGQSAVLGDGRVHQGDIYQLVVPMDYRPSDVRCILFRMTHGLQERLFPSLQGPWPTMEAFHRGSEGMRLDVVLQPPCGHQVLTLVVIPAEGMSLKDLDGRAEERLLEAFFDRRLPGGTHTLEVMASG